MTPLLEIKDLHATVADTPILKGINLTINHGEIHAIMGPNGSGKSTMSYVLSGRDGYEVRGGDVLLNGESILEMEADTEAIGYALPTVPRRNRDCVAIVDGSDFAAFHIGYEAWCVPCGAARDVRVLSMVRHVRRSW